MQILVFFFLYSLYRGREDPHAGPGATFFYHIHHDIIQHAQILLTAEALEHHALLISLPEYATESVIEVFLSALHQVKPSDSQH